MFCLLLLFTSLTRGQTEFEEAGEIPVEREAEFTSLPTKVLVNEGGVIRLPCFVDKIEGYVLLWKHGDTILSVGDRVIEKGRRLTLEKETNGNYLTIHDAKGTDGGDYMCQISAYRPKDIVHSVIVRTRPSVYVDRDVVTVDQGEKVELKCSVRGGYPVPEISWSKEGSSLPSGESRVYNHNLIISNLKSKDSGVYMCRGDNGFSSDHLATVQLRVQGPPSIVQEKQFIHSSLDEVVSVSCNVISNPPATVQWFTDLEQEPLSKSDFNMSHDNLTGIHKIWIPLKQTNDTQESKFYCKAINQHGEAVKVIMVTNKPSLPEVTIGKENINFKVKSHLEVSFEVMLKNAALSVQKSLQFRDVKKIGENSWEGNYKIKELTSVGASEIKLKASNSYGVGPTTKWILIDSDTSSSIILRYNLFMLCFTYSVLLTS